MKLAIASHVDRQQHGPCHRCGWTQDVTRMSRKHAHELGVPAHTALCDECVSDLGHRQPVLAGIGVGERSAARAASTGHRTHQRRSVA